MNTKIIPLETIISKIFLIRNQKVMVDSDIARIYGVTTKRLNQQVKRNLDRFPADFMFRLTAEEYDNLRLQIATPNIKGGRRYPPYVFTEHGVAMLSAVLNSKKAVETSIFIIRAFVKLRELIATHKNIQKALREIESKLLTHEAKITQIVQVLNQITATPSKPKRKMGF